MKRISLVAALTATLSACGGGAPATPSECTSRVVTVALLGDSTQYGIDGTTTTPGYFGDQAVNNPGAELQAVMNTQFGLGAVIVTNYGVSGTTAAQAPRGVTADVIVENYGINDMVGGYSQLAYHQNIEALHPTIIETPMPTVWGDPREQAYLDTDASFGLPVVDVYSYVRSLPNWQSYFPHADSVHGSDALYQLIVDNVLAPAVARQVAPLRCQ